MPYLKKKELIIFQVKENELVYKKLNVLIQKKILSYLLGGIL